MSPAFIQAYNTYMVRKQVERQAHLLRLRQELTVSTIPTPLGRVTGRATSENRGGGLN